MSAAEHLREAIDVGCTRDDHDHVGDHRAEVLLDAALVADRFTERWPDMEAMKADGIIGPFTALSRLANELRRMAAGKDTGSTPAGESTQPADDEPMRTARTVIDDFPWSAYGIDLDGADPAWVGDLASAIAGALTGTDGNDEPAPDFFQPGHTYTHRDGSTFRCDAITTHPESGWRVALGWHTDTADWTFVAVRHIDHWLYEYDLGTPTEAPTTYASTRGEPGGDA